MAKLFSKDDKVQILTSDLKGKFVDELYKVDVRVKIKKDVDGNKVSTSASVADFRETTPDGFKGINEKRTDGTQEFRTTKGIEDSDLLYPFSATYSGYDDRTNEFGKTVRGKRFGSSARFSSVLGVISPEAGSSYSVSSFQRSVERIAAFVDSQNYARADNEKYYVVTDDDGDYKQLTFADLRARTGTQTFNLHLLDSLSTDSDKWYDNADQSPSNRSRALSDRYAGWEEYNATCTIDYDAETITVDMDAKFNFSQDYSRRWHTDPFTSAIDVAIENQTYDWSDVDSDRNAGFFAIIQWDHESSKRLKRRAYAAGYTANDADSDGYVSRYEFSAGISGSDERILRQTHSSGAVSNGDYSYDSLIPFLDNVAIDSEEEDYLLEIARQNFANNKGTKLSSTRTARFKPFDISFVELTNKNGDTVIKGFVPWDAISGTLRDAHVDLTETDPLYVTSRSLAGVIDTCWCDE